MHCERTFNVIVSSDLQSESLCIQSKGSENVGAFKLRSVRKLTGGSWRRTSLNQYYLKSLSKPMRDGEQMDTYHRGAGDFHAVLIFKRRGGCFVFSFSIIFILFCAMIMSVCTVSRPSLHSLAPFLEYRH
jgi:hypothetical protein